jgi:hypothetical protein
VSTPVSWILPTRGTLAPFKKRRIKSAQDGLDKDWDHLWRARRTLSTAESEGIVNWILQVVKPLMSGLMLGLHRAVGPEGALGVKPLTGWCIACATSHGRAPPPSTMR